MILTAHSKTYVQDRTNVNNDQLGPSKGQMATENLFFVQWVRTLDL